MSDKVNIGLRLTDINVSPQFDTYSKVIIYIDDDSDPIEVGDDTGRVLELYNPLGTRELAKEILSKLRGFQYQPYQALSALLDPAAEIGDAVDTPESYGGIYTRSREFGKLMKSDVSAPCDEEIENEFQFEDPQYREFKREVGDVRSSLRFQSDLIQMEVEERKEQGATLHSEISQTATSIMNSVVAKEGGQETSFAWELTADSHKWYSNGKEVMSISASGLVVSGVVKAESGEIGGFKITRDALTYNDLEFGSSNKSAGAYIGSRGIQYGKNFRVDTFGGLTASSLTLKGNITFLNSDGTVAGTMSAADLKDNAENGASAYSWTSSNGSYTYSGASYGYNYNSATSYNTASYPSYFTCDRLIAKRFFSFGSYDIGTSTLTYMDGNGVARSATFLVAQR